MPRAALALTPLLLAALALGPACTGDDAGTSAGSTSTSSSASASATSSSDSATSTSGPASATDTGSASGSGTSTTADTGTSSSSSGASGVSSTTDTSGGTSGSTGGDTGEPNACADLGDVDFGDCDAVLGVIFDGTSCKTLSGCSCEPHCDAIFKHAAACATTCAAEGHCRLELFEGKGIFKGPWEMDALCDQVDVCGGELGALGEVLPAATCEAMAPYPCDGAPGCTHHLQGPISPEAWAQFCAASLLPGVSLVACTVYGP
ncbi:MAG: hypothetical protein H6711_03020 [Myxococcales bacterium]|nr:hypothetical protein [Myxococcales bacterium]